MMRNRLWLIAMTLPVVGCASSSASPPPTPAPPPDYLFVDNSADPTVAACLANELARTAERDANRQRLIETGARVSEINARTSAEFADRSRTQAAAAALRATAAAAENPRSQTAQAAASSASSAAVLAQTRAAYTARQAAAAARAKEEIAGSARSAHHFARLATAHAEIFDSRSSSEGEQTAASKENELRALEVIRSIGESNPDLHWLYVDQFLTGFDSLPGACN
jgi:hypothetical protein